MNPTQTASVAESTNTAVSFAFRGETYNVPPTSAWPFRALEAYEDGKLAAFLRAILGTDYARLADFTVGDVSEFVEELSKGLGIQGN